MTVTGLGIGPKRSEGRAPLAVRASRRLWRLAADPAYRGTMWLLWRQPAAAFQPFGDTKPDRYPRIFAFVRDQFAGRDDLNILSFGCSTGEEVFALRRYFPHATIKGVDINRGAIAIARRRLRRAPDPRLSFTTGASTAAEPASFYDAIFCLSVLRHGDLSRPSVTRCDHLIRFADFAAAIADFDRCLKPGGLLALRHSNFRLSDAPAAAAFATVLRIPADAKTPLFGCDNRLLKDATYPDTVFRKISASAQAAARPTAASGT
jgi:SAM-dependent methyltransferase